MSRRKIHRCNECNEPLRHVQTNQWMCQQSPSRCKQSTKIIFMATKEEEE